MTIPKPTKVILGTGHFDRSPGSEGVTDSPAGGGTVKCLGVNEFLGGATINFQNLVAKNNKNILFRRSGGQKSDGKFLAEPHSLQRPKGITLPGLLQLLWPPAVFSLGLLP